MKNKKFEKMKEKLSKDKKQLSKTLDIVQKSTASLGKFDKKIKNEKKQSLLNRKRVNPEMNEKDKEKERNKRLLNYVLNNK
jgi:hypothetical protein